MAGGGKWKGYRGPPFPKNPSPAPSRPDRWEWGVRGRDTPALPESDKDYFPAQTFLSWGGK